MGHLVNFSAYRAKPADPTLDQIIDDEFLARREMRKGRFDDGLTIPMDIHSPCPHSELRAASPLDARKAASGFVPSPQSRGPRPFLSLLADAFVTCSCALGFSLCVAAPFLALYVLFG